MLQSRLHDNLKCPFVTDKVLGVKEAVSRPNPTLGINVGELQNAQKFD
jgi:hypothetical protein